MSKSIYKKNIDISEDDTAKEFMEYMAESMSNIKVNLDKLKGSKGDPSLDYVEVLSKFNTDVASQETSQKDFKEYLKEKMKPIEDECKKLTTEELQKEYKERNKERLDEYQKHKKILKQIENEEFSKNSPIAPLIGMFDNSKKDKVAKVLDELATYMASEVYGASDVYDTGIQKKVFSVLGKVGTAISKNTPQIIKNRIPKVIKENGPKISSGIKSFMGLSGSPDDKMKEALAASGLFDESIYDYDNLLEQFKALGEKFMNNHKIDELIPKINNSELQFAIFKTVATIILLTLLGISLLSTVSMFASFLGFGANIGVGTLLPAVSLGGAMSQFGAASALLFMKNTILGILLSGKVMVPAFITSQVLQQILPPFFTAATSKTREEIAGNIKKNMNLRDILKQSILGDEKIMGSLKDAIQKNKSFENLRDIFESVNIPQTRDEIFKDRLRDAFISDNLEKYSKLVMKIFSEKQGDVSVLNDTAQKFFDSMNYKGHLILSENQLNSEYFHVLKNDLNLGITKRNDSRSIVEAMKKIGDEYIKDNFNIVEEGGRIICEPKSKVEGLFKYIEMHKSTQFDAEKSSGYFVLKDSVKMEDIPEEHKSIIKFLMTHAKASYTLDPHTRPDKKAQAQPNANPFLPKS